jgi:hypothetical protein
MQKPITNVRRSGDMTDYVSIKVNLYTPEQKLKELHTRMVGYVKDHSRYFKPVSSMQITEMQTTYITVRFSLEFKGNAQDYGKRLSNRTDFMLHLKKQVTDLEIKIENDQEIKVIGA